MNAKKVLLWSVYNFGAGILEIVFILYFSQWLVVDRGVPDFVFNAAFIVSSALLLLTAPVWSAIADKTGRRIGKLRVTTIAAFASFLLTGIVASAYPSHWLLATSLFTLGLYFYLFAGVFWSGYLPDLSSSESYGASSGWAMCSEWIGQIVGVLITLPLVNGVVFFGLSGRPGALLLGAILFIVGAMPMVTFFRDGITKAVAMKFTDEYTNTIRSFLAVSRVNGLGWFFLAFFFYNDAIITAANNFPLYLQRVFDVSDTVKSFVVLAILVSSAIGALISGYVVDRVGFKKALLWNLAGWIVILPLLSVLRNFVFFAAVAVLMGIWFGSIWVIARTLTARLTPPSMFNRSFTYYVLMERFATLIGPLTWSLVLGVVSSKGALNYHVAILTMTIYVIAGFLFARLIPSRPAGV